MELNIYLLIFLASVAVVGIIEWLKNLLSKFFTIPGWVWSIIVLLSSLVCGFIAVYAADVTSHTPLMAVLVGLVVLAIAQIGYEAIKKAIISRAEKALGIECEKIN